jgi:HK97 family phage major capsid protein
MNERILRTIQGLETTGGRLFGGTVGYPAVGPIAWTQTGNTGLRLLNKPVFITPSATYDVTVDDTPLLWLGNPQSYCIVDRVGISVEYIPHVFADAAGSLPTGQRRLYFYYRNSGKPINVDGGRILFVLNS